jgi:hypothetical protein
VVGRRTAAQGTCNRPAVMCLSIFLKTSGQECRPPHRKRTTALQLYAPMALRQSAVQHADPGPHVMQPARRLLGAEKSHRHLRQCRAPSGTVVEDRKDKFSEPVQRLEAPRAWLNSDIKYKGHGPVSRGNGRDSRRSHRRAGSNCTNRSTRAANRSLIRLWPHLQARILP